MRLREIECELSKLSPFSAYKIQYEQYTTPVHLAARLAYTAHYVYSDIEGKTVLDLGVGTGMLSAAASCFSPESILGIDVDEEALSIAEKNMQNFSAPFSTLQGKIPELVLKQSFDVCIMNPPFGTKKDAHSDTVFLEYALKHCETVYSMHKSSTRDFLVRKYKADIVATMKFDIPKIYSFHRKNTAEVEVDLARFCKKKI